MLKGLLLNRVIDYKRAILIRKSFNSDFLLNYCEKEKIHSVPKRSVLSAVTQKGDPNSLVSLMPCALEQGA